jgi:hypothetical protein
MGQIMAGFARQPDLDDADRLSCGRTKPAGQKRRQTLPADNLNQKGNRMKLNSISIERALSQMDAQAVPESHPAVPKFNSLFGDHTFFIDGKGLSIVEPIESIDRDLGKAQLVNLASWTDDSRTNLVPHKPETTDIVLQLGKAA